MTEAQKDYASPSERIKASGFKSLREVAELLGVSQNTVINWHNDRPDFLDIVLAGLVAQRTPAPPPAPIPVTVMHCQCSEEGCKVYQLGGIGRFTHGSGFTEDDAHLIASLLNQHRARRA